MRTKMTSHYRKSDDSLIFGIQVLTAENIWVPVYDGRHPLRFETRDAANEKRAELRRRPAPHAPVAA